MRHPISLMSTMSPKRFWLAAGTATTATCLAVAPAVAAGTTATQTAGTLAHAAPAVAAAAPAAAAPVATAAAAPTTPPSVADASTAAVAAAAELSAATTSQTAAEQAVANANAAVEAAQVELRAARAALGVATDDAKEAGQVREAAVEAHDLLEAGAVQTVDPATAVAAGLSLAELIDPFIDPVERMDDAEREADLAKAVEARDRVDLVGAGARESAASAGLDRATSTQIAATAALDEAVVRQASAVDAKSAADQVLADAKAAEETARIAAARAEAAALAARSMERPAIADVTSPYGMRTHPITGVYKLHSGTDFSVGDGKARAARAGTVTDVTSDSAYGNMVTISHGTIDGDSVVTRYAHLASATVSVGTAVAAGDVVGNIGATGYATGPHLHFEVLVNGEFVDPMTWL